MHNKSTLLFTRITKSSLTQAVTLTVTHDREIISYDQILSALKKGITNFIETTEQGTRAWNNSQEELNIGDFLSIPPELIFPHLIPLGIYNYQFEQLRNSASYDYDTILADPQTLYTPPLNAPTPQTTTFTLTQLVPPSWTGWFESLISEDSPFAWGSNNAHTLVSADAFYEECKEKLETAIDVPQPEIDAFLQSIKDLKSTLIDLSN